MAELDPLKNHEAMSNAEMIETLRNHYASYTLLSPMEKLRFLDAAAKRIDYLATQVGILKHLSGTVT